MNEFLTTVAFLEERVNANIDIYLSDEEAREFQKLAKGIDPERYFTIYGCQSCIKTLVKFVFDNKDGITFIKKETFPLQKPTTDESDSTKEV